MSNSLPLIIEETNLSRAWSRVFLHIMDNPGKEISPLLITLTGFNNGMPNENKDILEALDSCLTANDDQQVHTVANTIFPSSLWRLSQGDRHKLFEIYLNTLPRYKALEPHKNRRGLYFERLIAFGSEPNNGNQLEYIISQCHVRELEDRCFKPRFSIRHETMFLIDDLVSLVSNTSALYPKKIS